MKNYKQKIILAIFLIGTFAFLSCFSQASLARTIRVKNGETLSSIALKELGNASAWQKLARLNHLKNSNILWVGQKIRLPSSAKPQKEKNSFWSRALKLSKTETANLFHLRLGYVGDLLKHSKTDHYDKIQPLPPLSILPQKFRKWIKKELIEMERPKDWMPLEGKVRLSLGGVLHADYRAGPWKKVLPGTSIEKGSRFLIGADGQLTFFYPKARISVNGLSNFFIPESYTQGLNSWWGIQLFQGEILVRLHSNATASIYTPLGMYRLQGPGEVWMNLRRKNPMDASSPPEELIINQTAGKGTLHSSRIWKDISGAEMIRVLSDGSTERPAPPRNINFPSPLLPLDSIRVGSSKILFQWRPAPGSLMTRLKISTRKDLTHPLLEREFYTSEAKIGDLAEGTYFWKVSPIYENHFVIRGGEAPRKLIVDRKAPKLKVQLLPSSKDIPQIKIQTEIGSFLTLGGVAQGIMSETSKTFPLSLSDGLNIFEVNVADDAANEKNIFLGFWKYSPEDHPFQKSMNDIITRRTVLPVQFHGRNSSEIQIDTSLQLNGSGEKSAAAFLSLKTGYQKLSISIHSSKAPLKNIKLGLWQDQDPPSINDLQFVPDPPLMGKAFSILIQANDTGVGLASLASLALRQGTEQFAATAKKDRKGMYRYDGFLPNRWLKAEVFIDEIKVQDLAGNIYLLPLIGNARFWSIPFYHKNPWYFFDWTVK